MIARLRRALATRWLLRGSALALVLVSVVSIVHGAGARPVPERPGVAASPGAVTQSGSAGSPSGAARHGAAPAATDRQRLGDAYTESVAPTSGATAHSVGTSPAQTPESETSPAVHLATRTPVADLKIMNYYPSSAAWSQMWLSYNPGQVDSDFSAIRSLGANAVRIIVQAPSLGYPSMLPVYGAHLSDMISRAAAHGLAVQLTLFDWFDDYSDLAGSQAWARQVLAPLAGSPTIALVELQNEIDLDTSGAATWVSVMLPYVKGLLPGVPATVSVAGSQTAAQLGALSGAAGAALDVVDVHLYGPPTSVATALEAAKRIADGRPLVVGELGSSTYGANASCADQAQERFYAEAFGMAARFGAVTAAPWTLNDFTDSAVPSSYLGEQQHYGLRRADGTWKPAAAVVRSYFAHDSVSTRLAAMDADTFPQKDIDPVAACIATTASDLTSWTRFGGAQAGTTGVRTGQGEGGGSAAYLSSTGGSSTVVPSLMQPFPLLRGTAISLSARVRLASGTGRTQLAIAWFRGGNYLGQSSSRAASNASTGWQALSVSARPPSGADNFQVHLKSADNSGTAYFDRIRLKQV